MLLTLEDKKKLRIRKKFSLFLRVVPYVFCLIKSYLFKFKYVNKGDFYASVKSALKAHKEHKKTLVEYKILQIKLSDLKQNLKSFKLRSFRSFGEVISAWWKYKIVKAPLLIVGNHMNMIDSFMFMVPITGILSRTLWTLYPWHIPNKDNFDPNSFKGLKRYFWKLIYYSALTLPVDRNGQGEEAEKQRAWNYNRMMWVLEQGGSLFLFPELGRTRTGEFNPKNIKKLVGKMLIDNPNLAVLAIYCRAEEQEKYGFAPSKGAKVRGFCHYFVPQIPSDPKIQKSNKKQINSLAEQVFDAIGNLQEKWFLETNYEELKIRRYCSGNDLIDLSEHKLRKRFYDQSGNVQVDEKYLSRFLSDEEIKNINFLSENQKDPFITFCKMFAAKEAAYKAFVQGNVFSSDWEVIARLLKVDLVKNTVTYSLDGCYVKVSLIKTDDYIYASASFRGVYFDKKNKNIVNEIFRLNGVEKGAAKRSKLYDHVSSKYGLDRSKLVVCKTDKSVPTLYYDNKILDIGLSFTDKGQYAAFSCADVPLELAIIPKEGYYDRHQ